MVNKQRVRRIRGFIYTCLFLLIFVPVILMIVVSIMTMDLLSDIRSVLLQDSTAITEDVPAPVSDPEKDLSYDDMEMQGGNALFSGEKPSVNSQDATLAKVIIADNSSTQEEEKDPLLPSGRYVDNTYLPDTHPQLYFDTIPVVSEPKANTLYLTFDNTPSSNYKDILAVLEKHAVSATFFLWWNEHLAENNATIYKKLVDAGHQIGIHCHSSNATLADLYASTDAFLDHYSSFFDTLYSVAGRKPRLYRLPGGSISPDNTQRQNLLREIKTELDARGFRQFDWNASAQDAVYPPLSKEEILQNLRDSAAGDPVVILAHDGTGSASTAEALDEFISQYKAEGYTFGVLEDDTPTVSFLGEESPEEETPGEEPPSGHDLSESQEVEQ